MTSSVQRLVVTGAYELYAHTACKDDEHLVTNCELSLLFSYPQSATTSTTMSTPSIWRLPCRLGPNGFRDGDTSGGCGKMALEIPNHVRYCRNRVRRITALRVSTTRAGRATGHCKQLDRALRRGYGREDFIPGRRRERGLHNGPNR